MDGVALAANRNLDVGAWLHHGERLGAGLHAAIANAFEPWSDVVRGDEVDNARGVDEGTRPGTPRAGAGKNDERDENEEADGG